MKKYLILLLAAMLGLGLIPAGLDKADAEKGFIILAHVRDGDSDTTEDNPVNIITMYEDNISLLGACNTDFPLYVNGEEIPTTQNGFFAVYTPLEAGDNPFVFENGEAVTELTVARKTPEPYTPPQRIDYPEVVYGVTIHPSASRFYEGDDDNKPGIPLPKNTVFQILAQYGECYIIEDESYVFKSNVEILEGSFDAEAYLSLEDVTMTFKEPPTSLSEAVVLLDAGHGGLDPGALGPLGRFGKMEKDFNLYVAEKARDYLEDLGITVVFPRFEDENVPVVERIEFFAAPIHPLPDNDSEQNEYDDVPDLVISVHANSMPLSHDFRGTEGPLMFFTLDHSEAAANTILESVAEMTEHEHVPAIRRNFAMARYTAAASMLFEMGFMCNPDEYERLLDTDYLDLMGEALAEGIVAYLQSIIPPESEREPESEAEQEAETESEPEHGGTDYEDYVDDTLPMPLPESGLTFEDITSISAFVFVVVFLVYNILRRKER